MSKFTLAAIAGASAAIGAATATAILSSTKRQTSVVVPITPPASSINAHETSRTTPFPPAPIQRDDPRFSIAAPVNPSGLFQYGFPGPIQDRRNAESLTSSFNRRTRNPDWVVEHITPASLLMRNGDRRHSQFEEDKSIPEKFRAKLSDYQRSGYDRGHQVPAADCKWSQEAMNATFSLSNMCPQVGEGFNRDYWAHLEDFCRRLTSFYPSVRIVTGPLYLPKRDSDGKWKVSYEVIGHPPNVAVPTHFYKVIFAEDGKPGGNVSLAAFVLPNAPISNDKPLRDFEVPIEAVERASGLEFANLLPVARKRSLCKEVSCSVIIKEYADRQRTGLPAPGQQSFPSYQSR